MPIPVKWLYVTTKYRGYLSAIKQHGPIVHPAKITEAEAQALVLAGVDLIVHDPVTKMTYHMGINNVANPTPPKKIPEPIEEIKLPGAPKVVEEPKVEEPVVVEPKVVTTEEEVAVEDEATEETEESEEAPLSELDILFEGIRNKTITEADIDFSKYSKSVRRKIRAALAAVNEEQVLSEA